MGANQSQSQRQAEGPCDPAHDADDEDQGRKISISNKMVERLVEDASLAGVSPPPRGAGVDPRDKVLVDRLRVVDEKHSEKWGLTIQNLSTIAGRIDARTAHMRQLQPVCPGCKEAVLECYENAQSDGDYLKCYDVVASFNSCVRDTTMRRLRAATERDARETARRRRHVARARQNMMMARETTA
ncbi:hypothetical protein JYU34_016248 [Plutella xylostella]|uniref:COX assembly mitochondrial protein n=1 Tax=Plutella xylostella TaxID=51655 RepID=A0ABQ7Q3J1_PLUXY|nr:hypothetical protein JYU34_016248 [Plutella xylostella]